MFSTNERPSRAAINMSNKSLASSGIHRLRRTQDRTPHNVVWVLFYGATLDKIHAPSEHVLQLLFHRHQICEGPRVVRFERDEHIHIAVRPEIVAQHRTEEGQLDDLPFAAERRD